MGCGDSNLWVHNKVDFIKMNVLQGNSHSIGPANNGHNKKGPPNLKLVKVAINKSCSSTFPIEINF